MKTRFGIVEKAAKKVVALSHNLVTNEISGYVEYYLSEDDRDGGVAQPLQTTPISWNIDGDNSLLFDEAMKRAG